MEAIFINIINMSITAGWLIVAVLLLRGVFRNIPKNVRCILWGFVGVRLICPYSIDTVLSLIPSVQTVQSDIGYMQEPIIDSGIPAVNQAVNPALSRLFAPEVGASVNPLQIWLYLAMLVWIAGMVFLMTYVIVSYGKLRWKVRESVKWKEHIYLCDHVDTPFILGLFRPRIFLPSDIEEQQIAYVISHEKAHLARRDHLWKPLGFALLMVYWFHPLCWAAYWMFCRDIELACDERVIRDFDIHSKKAYCEALLECSAARRRIVACPLAFGEVGVKERIKYVLKYKKPAIRTLLCAAAVCVIFALCFLTNPKADTKENPLFGHSYIVTDILYDAPQYSLLMRLDDAPLYYMTEDRNLIETRIPQLYTEKEAHEWNVRGQAKPLTLTRENFDQYIEMEEVMQDITPSKMRGENQKAWYVPSSAELDSVFYYILQQKNGDIYLTYGYEGKNSVQEEGRQANIRWIFKLKKKDAFLELFENGTAQSLW